MLPQELINIRRGYGQVAPKRGVDLGDGHVIGG